ncbi:Colicin I receptor precursor [Komagataeibacter saccharivorans]|uniref:Colicin I receptor n=2 Tax=Acetobacteraceae TaxID=433 RepID=A0A347WEA7_9PROT|nr:TonB-dependent receptor [Komagataeibacter saccharivorans]AXY23200.1 Colicin I receptor precursor [Komagataeibacter saccharivorans]PMP98928.1 Vitamin B12 transporter BtuB [Komagataeibacter saccharivorans]QBL92880.1 Vitamin B12 transporter BtuB [Komagataeibacter saccharivorans]
MRNRKLPFLLFLLTGISTVPMPGYAAATAETQTKDKKTTRNSGEAEQLIVTGTRTTNRKLYQSMSPVDVTTKQQILRTGQTNLRDALIVTSPSVTTPAFGTGAGGLTDAISLRGLNPDETLILINGKRRHPTANIYASPGSQQGSTPTDLDMIPMSMIDHIEILRDGAAAQYGSDAVAGVVNIILKSQDHGISAQSLVGNYGNNQGFTAGGMFNEGFRIGHGGSLQLSFDYRHQDPTHHDGTDTRYNAKVDRLFGIPASDREALGVNFNLPLTEHVTFYGNATYAHRDAKAWAFYRTMPSGYSGIYPNGYSPIQTSDENDMGVTAGFKGDNFFGFSWDVSSTYGSDWFHSGLDQSINLDLLQATGTSPNSFSIGNYRNAQWVNNVDLRRSIAAPFFAAPVAVALGFENRNEQYEMGAGDAASLYGNGSQALPGLPDVASGVHGRHIYAGYADVNFKPLNGWEVDLAGRLEHYSDVGNAISGKVSTRYEINKWVAIRGTISNGFRAPTLAEENFTNLNVSPEAASGVLAVNSAAARSLGAKALKPERSTNLSGGIVINPLKKLHIAADVYQINIRDRIVEGGYASGAEALNAIDLSGIPVPTSLDPSAVSVNYFTNGASTRTQGLDITATYLTDFKKYGRVDWSLGLNLNRTRVSHMSYNSNGTPVLNAQQVAFLTTTTPRSKIIMSGHWSLGRFDATLRETRWGSVTDEMQYTTGPNAWSVNTFFPFEAKPRWVTDLEFGYAATRNLHLAIGGNNIFNTHPTEVPAQGRAYGVTKYDYYASQLAFNGGFYYFRADMKF